MTDKQQIRGGALLALALHEKGIEQVFTLSGGFCNPALEGFEIWRWDISRFLPVNLSGLHFRATTPKGDTHAALSTS